MASFQIKGLSGKRKLSGVLPVKGAKNSVLKSMAASILFKDRVEIHNVPCIEDVGKMRDLLEDLGVAVADIGPRALKFEPGRQLKTSLNGEIAKKLRSSIVLTGPLLAREGRVSFPHPGGCVIGARPIDVFLDSFLKMGATINTEENVYVIRAKKLKGADIFFKAPSVTATETIMMAAVLAKGTTRLFNAACEPEIKALADFLSASGAEIFGAGTHTITIRGRSLLKKGIFFTPPDRIEAGSFVIIAALCGKNIKITGCDTSHMRALLGMLESAGVNIVKRPMSLEIGSAQPSFFRAIDVKTHEYPGFPTDLQAPMAVFLTQCRGQSKIFETVFEGRLNYLNDLSRMGADVLICDQHRAIIEGPRLLRGREMESPDLRAGLAFLLAAVMAKGDSVITNVEYIDRGYEKIENRLSAVGADITRVE